MSPKHVAVIGSVEVDAIDLVDDLAHERAVLHVVVGVLERRRGSASAILSEPSR